jgi:Bifunctional DNA primase/polymerase, N-terminal
MSEENGLGQVLRYAAAGMRIFPVNARGAPLTKHGFKDATSDPEVIKAWRRERAHCDFGWAVPANTIVVDLDMKHGKNGFKDFRDRAGYDPHDVLTPQSTTPSGGMHLIYKATKPYKNSVAINGTGIDTRTEGGYVVLPLAGNGRQWLRPLIGAALLPAPAWLDCVLRPAPLVLAPRAAVVPPSSDSWAQKKALAELGRACDRIAAAPCGAQDATRHAQCFYIGGLIARGDLGYKAAYVALLEAALAMPAYHDPSRNIEERVARSIKAGMERPLNISETEQWMRDFRARMRLKRPGARHG